MQTSNLTPRTVYGVAQRRTWLKWLSSTALRTASPASVDEGALLPLLRLNKAWESFFTFSLTSSLQPVRKSLWLCLQNISRIESIHCSPPALLPFWSEALLVISCLGYCSSSYNFLCFWIHPHLQESVLHSEARGILFKHVRASPSAQDRLTKSCVIWSRRLHLWLLLFSSSFTLLQQRVFLLFLSHVRHTLPQFSLFRTSFSQLSSLSSFPTFLRFRSAHLAPFLSRTAPGSIFHPALLCWFPCFFFFLI